MGKNLYNQYKTTLLYSFDFCFPSIYFIIGFSRTHSRRHDSATPVRVAASPHGHGAGVVQQSPMVQPAASSLSAHYPQGVQQATALQPGSQGQQQILVARPQLQQQTHPMNRPRKCRCYLFLESLPNRPRIVVKHVLALIHPDFNDPFAFMIFFRFISLLIVL